jgi:hypothetical protein
MADRSGRTQDPDVTGLGNDRLKERKCNRGPRQARAHFLWAPVRLCLTRSGTHQEKSLDRGLDAASGSVRRGVHAIGPRAIVDRGSACDCASRAILARQYCHASMRHGFYRSRSRPYRRHRRHAALATLRPVAGIGRLNCRAGRAAPRCHLRTARSAPRVRCGYQLARRVCLLRTLAALAHRHRSGRGSRKDSSRARVGGVAARERDDGARRHSSVARPSSERRAPLPRATRRLSPARHRHAARDCWRRGVWQSPPERKTWRVGRERRTR